MFAAARAPADRSGTINATSGGTTKETGEPNHAYAGSAVNTLTQTAANDDASGVQTSASFAAVAGTTEASQSTATPAPRVGSP
jgi:hypothetical protein